VGFGALIFNFIGAVVRWSYGTIWRTIANKRKYKFKAYLNGPENSDNWFDLTSHTFVNRLIGAITLFLICLLIIKMGI
jgi:hypothetical protein